MTDVGKMDNAYELRIKVKGDGPDVVGLNFCEGNGRKVTLSYDNQSRYLVLDRTHSSDAEIPKFDRISYIRIPGDRSDLQLTAFVDKSTLEVFVNDGERTLTLLTFAGNDQTGASVYSTRGNSEIEYMVWPLKSIWDTAEK